MSPYDNWATLWHMTTLVLQYNNHEIKQLWNTIKVKIH